MSEILSRNVLLNIKNLNGSAQHYYHFLLGFLLPLASEIEDLQLNDEIKSIIIRSCGPMDRHIKALNLSKIVFYDANTASGTKQIYLSNEFINIFDRHIVGYDNNWGYYDHYKIKKAAQVIRRLLTNDRAEAPILEDKMADAHSRNIVLINRDIEPFHNSPFAEVLNSGSQRRSIKNFSELQQCVEAQTGNVTTHILENATLSEQISLFSKADVIIAQHGASLANLIWSRPGTKVIEIAHQLPPIAVNTFSSLAKSLDLEFRRVSQQGPHGECDIKMVEHLLTNNWTV